MEQGEWILHHAKVPVEQYREMASKFTADSFSASDWADFAQDCGFRYVTITTKHHDGFQLYNSRVSSYNTMKAAPLRTDVIGELSKELRKRDLGFFAYYSLSDWDNVDYFPLGWSARHVSRIDGNWGEYSRYMRSQILGFPLSVSLTTQSSWSITALMAFGLMGSGIVLRMIGTYPRSTISCFQSTPVSSSATIITSTPFRESTFKYLKQTCPAKTKRGFGATYAFRPFPLKCVSRLRALGASHGQPS